MENVINIKSLLRSSSLPKLEARMLLQHILNVDRVWLIAHDIDELSPQVQDQFQELENKRKNGAPMAYILGQREFMGYMFKVNENVLIPRPETEHLVEAALNHIEKHNNENDLCVLEKGTLKDKRSKSSLMNLECRNNIDGLGDLNKENCRVLDLGTGSGAIAVSIALSAANADVSASDISDKALDIARENADNLNARVNFIQSNWYENIPDSAVFDVIVSNPPYIAADDIHLNQGDVRFEPSIALTDGATGLTDLHAIISSAPKFLNKNGVLLVEHGWDQSSDVQQLMLESGFKQVHSLNDLADIARVTIGHI